MNQQQLDQAFHALGDSTRRAILARLAVGQATVSELTKPFNLTQPTISKHLRVLEDAGLIEGGRDAQRRPRKLVPSAMKDMADWIDRFHDLWERRFSNLEALISQTRDEEG